MIAAGTSKVILLVSLSVFAVSLSHFESASAVPHQLRMSLEIPDDDTDNNKCIKLHKLMSNKPES